MYNYIQLVRILAGLQYEAIVFLNQLSIIRPTKLVLLKLKTLKKTLKLINLTLKASIKFLPQRIGPTDYRLQ